MVLRGRLFYGAAMKISKREFVESAYRQARESGLNDTQARLAASQAALETGYGRSVVGNNYFGIKAGSSWNGPSVTAGTWEDTANGPVRERARFRSYSNPVSAFGDWASTVGRRWSSAFNAPTFNEAVEGLNYGQPGGYATDRNYGAKLRSINARYGPQAEEVDGIMSAINPRETAVPTPRPMSLAEQYGLLDTARGLTRDIGLLRQDVMEQDPMGQLRRDLLAREAAYKMATAPAPQPEQLQMPPPSPLPPIDVPEPTAMTAYAPTAEAMAGTPANASASVGGLISPEEQAMVRDQQIRLAEQGPNRRARLGGMAKKGLGAFGGGLLGGMLLGPIGAVAGGLLGPALANHMTTGPRGTGVNYFPEVPKNTPRGDGRQTDYGRSVQRESRQFDRAVRSGRGGLW